MTAATRVATFPVVEVFGPTVQGEGALAGLPTHFVRFGGCDFRCSWCDSMFAVEPAQVRANAEKLSAEQIMERLDALDDGPEWVTLSGGNPAMLELGGFVSDLHHEDLRVSVEMQGSIWRDWLLDVDCLTVSPKPPSSGMAEKTEVSLPLFMAKAFNRPSGNDALKIVVFDEADFEWARRILRDYHWMPAFLSVGTEPIGQWGSEVTVARGHESTVRLIGERYAWLCEKVARDTALSHVRVLPQLHVVAWGHARGV